MACGDFLLPKKADLELEFIDGQIDKNKTTFNACRQYSGESTIRFDDGGITDETSKAPEEINVPAGSSIYVELKGKIDSAHSAIGDPVEFAVLRPVKVKGNVIVPKGALISGRISRMERAVYGGNVVRIILSTSTYISWAWSCWTLARNSDAFLTSESVGTDGLGAGR